MYDMSLQVKKSGGKLLPHSDLRGEVLEGINHKNHKHRKLNIGTWNVRTLNQSGRLENLKIEMNRLKIDVLGVSEMRWPDKGDFRSDKYRIIHTGAVNGQAGVGIILRGNIGYNVKEIDQVSERIVMVRIHTKPTDTVLVQVYMPTSGQEDEEVEKIYEELNRIIKRIKGDENLILLGDWNAVVGEGEDCKIIGKFGLGRRNNRGSRLIEFCEEHKLVIANTLFENHVRRRYTWKMPGDRERYQLDYIIIKQRFRNQVQNCHAYPGADIDSDHNLVMMKSELRFKKLVKKKKKLWNVDKLKDDKVQEKYEKQITDKIRTIQSTSAINEGWNNIKIGIKEVAEKVIGNKTLVARKPWITEKIIELIGDRRKLKNKPDKDSQEEYRRLRNIIYRECKRAKERMMEEKCEEIEEKMKKGKTDLAYRLVKENFNERRKYSRNIRDKKGNLILDEKEIANRWTKYLEELYKGPELEQLENEARDQIEIEEEKISREEFDRAIKELKGGKATGVDEIPAEILKLGGEELHNRLFELVVEMYDTGIIPKDFEKNIVVPIPKKVGADNCKDFRTLCLTTHSSKILCRIIKNKIEKVAENILGEDQYGFRKDKGTREPILALRMIIAKRLQKNKNTYIAFIDLEKAFDRVDWNKLFSILKKIGISFKDRRIIHSLYKNQTVIIKSGETEKEAKIRQGVRQGCALSPVLFNIYMEDALRKVREQKKIGIKFGNKTIDMLRFADDMAALAETKKELEEFLNTLNKVLNEDYNMKINLDKTKIMVSTIKERAKCKVKIGNTILEEVKEYCYLGSTISNDGRSKRDIRIRIAIAKRAFMKKIGLLTSRKISLEIRKRFIKTYVWSVLLYGSETWTIGEADRKMIESFETWCYRRMLKISWVDKITNVEVYNRGKTAPCLWSSLKTRRDKFVGHSLRHEGLLNNVIQSDIVGKNRKGRPRLCYSNQITSDVGCKNIREMFQLAQDRDRWRAASNRP